MEAQIPNTNDSRGANQDWLTAPQQARSLETLARFLRAADELLHEKPFADVTIAEIVTRAERTVGSFYARFEDKDALLRTLAQERMVQIAHAFRDELHRLDLPQLTGRELIATAVNSIVTAYVSERHVVRASLALASRDEPSRRFRGENYSMIGAELGEALAKTSDAPAADAIDGIVNRLTETVSAVLDARVLFGDPATVLPVDETVADVLEIANRLLD